MAHPPCIVGLVQLVIAILSDVQPLRLYSIGTAGGANVNQRLGDVAITNAAKLQQSLAENRVDYNDETFTCASWFPDTSLVLLFHLSEVASQSELQNVLQSAQNGQDGEALRGLTLADLSNAAIEPANLNAPVATSFEGVPLLTTDIYYIAPGDVPYAALEMDDAVVAHLASSAGVQFAFVRNISDTLVPSETPSGRAIPNAARMSWSSALYDRFGSFASFNGAMVTSATLAAASD